VRNGLFTLRIVILLKRLFEFGSLYSGQILSYTKIIGQLQDAGNTTTLANYLKLLSACGLLVGLDKYAGDIIRRVFFFYINHLAKSRKEKTLTALFAGC
jgi:predicted AAA+ superfamily ATPase